MTVVSLDRGGLTLPEVALAHQLDGERRNGARGYIRVLVGLDTFVLLVVGVAAARLGTDQASVHGVPLPLAGALLVPVWVGVLALARCYEPRFVGAGSQELARVARASSRLAAAVLVLAFTTRLDVARGYLLVLLSLGVAGVPAGRLAARSWLHRQRRLGRHLHRVVVVGPADTALELTMRLQRAPHLGLQVVGACVLGDPQADVDSEVPVVASLPDVLPYLDLLGADAACVSPGAGVTPEALRRLSYALEGSPVDLLVSPALGTVTGARLSGRDVPGLPLLHVAGTELRGFRRLVKTVADRSAGLLLLVLASPLLVVLGLAVRLTSPGPVLFVQERVGQGGQVFRMWKLRSMHVDAEAHREALVALNVHRDDGPQFKIYDDPRVTRVGRMLRRYSLDELPQLVNVVLGHMSLVGPRPPLPEEAARYDTLVHRRLLVKPGMTGLWQVSGRSDLGWEDAVRLDLHYVDNWSLGLDATIIARTVLAVLRPSGAY